MFMISQSMLREAKAFLCWDIFKDLSVQLMPLQKSTAFYFPPQNDLHSIVLFYLKDNEDFSEPLFLLFHEAGHVQQFRKIGDKEKYHKNLQASNGKDRMAFEQDAWDDAFMLFEQFLKTRNIESKELTDSFRRFSQTCINSYAVPTER